MNQTMNEMCKKDLPNLYEWCEEYAKKTGVKIYAANPPLGLVVEDLMGDLKKFKAEINSNMDRLVALVEAFSDLTKKDEPQKKEKKSK